MVDVINPLEFPQAAEISEATLQMAERLAAFKRTLKRHAVTVYANDHYGAWLSDFRQVKSRCRVLGGTAARLVDLLAPTPTDHVVLKPRHSAFYGTPLELLLTQLGCDSLVVCGLTTDMCVQMSAADAYLRGFHLWVPEDCCVAHEPAIHAQALAYMRRVFRADTRPSTDRDALGEWVARGLPRRGHSPNRRTP